MNEIWATVIGNVVTEPRHWRTESGLPVIRFRVASTPGNYDQGQWVDRPTNYLTVTAWRGLANNAASSLVKGQPVVAYGKVTVRSYTTNDGRTDHDMVLDAVAIGHNLARGTSAFHRGVRTGDQADGWAADNVGAGTDGAGARGLTAERIGEPEELAAAGLGMEFGRPQGSAGSDDPDQEEDAHEDTEEDTDEDTEEDTVADDTTLQDGVKVVAA